jgi:hypothetical protein
MLTPANRTLPVGTEVLEEVVVEVVPAAVVVVFKVVVVPLPPNQIRIVNEGCNPYRLDHLPEPGMHCEYQAFWAEQ